MQLLVLLDHKLPSSHIQGIGEFAFLSSKKHGGRVAISCKSTYLTFNGKDLLESKEEAGLDKKVFC